jgi:hypothetical protein
VRAASRRRCCASVRATGPQTVSAFPGSRLTPYPGYRRRR